MRALLRMLTGRRLASETPFSSEFDPEMAKIHADVWRIAWPSVITFLLMTTNAILDRIFVGTLGRDALAAVGVGTQLLFVLVSVSMAVSVGTTALVARFTGARTYEDSVRATAQSLSIGLVIGLASTALVYAGMDAYLRIVGLRDGALLEGRRFLGYALASTLPMMLSNICSASFRGLGDTRRPLYVMIGSIAVHVLGDWLLIFGHFGLPRMGVAGAGIAVTSANVFALLAYAWLLSRSSLGEALRMEELNPSIEWARRIFRIGIPAAFMALMRSTSLMGFTWVLARTAEKTAGVAALPIGLTAESIAFMPGFGYSIAASALVGQALGANNPLKAERYGWAANRQAVIIMSLMGLVFFVAARPFVSLFTRDPEVADLAVSYLRIMAVSEPFLAMGMVLTGALQGAGDTLRPAILTAATFWGFRLPVAAWLALGLGWNTVGAWIAMAATTILGGILTVALFKSDSWKTREL